MMTASSYATKFHSRLNRFRVDGEFADVTIECKDGAGGGIFKCHRVALASVSDFFKDEFRTPSNGADEQNIVLNGVSTTIFREVLQFIYTGDATISADSCLGMLQASEIFRISDLQDLCISFLSDTWYAFSVNNFLDIFVYAYESRKRPIGTIVIPYLVTQFELFSKADAFLKVPYDALNGLVIGRLKFRKELPNSDEVALAAITRWVVHGDLDRLQYYPQLKQLISHSDILPPLTEFLDDKLCDSADDAPFMARFPSSIGLVPVPAVENPETIQRTLHLYVRYALEDTIKIFSRSLDASAAWVRSGEIFQKNSNQRFTSLAVNDVFVHRMHYFGEGGACSSDETAPMFFAHVSAYMQVALQLKSPPVCFEKVDLCAIQNNIYAYHGTLPPNPIRTASVPKSRRFDDEEIVRGIYAYNCEVDDWLPVPEMKRKLVHSAITVLDRNLFMIGGGTDEDMNYVQAYDSREGIWRALPRTEKYYLGASACVLQGKIHVVGGYASDGCERFDSVAGKWEKLLQLESIEEIDSKAITHRDHILLFNRDPIPLQLNSTSTERYLDYQTGSYYPCEKSPEGQYFHWGNASIDLMVENPTNLVDCVVFKEI